MRSKFPLLMTLFAWLLATGSHWDLVQTYAWGSMIADYSRQMSVTAAVKKTFSAEMMCTLCHAVADAKQSSADTTAAGTRGATKVILFGPPARAAVYAYVPSFFGGVAPVLAPLSVARSAPPTPPPRASV
jgi:hypothetical protein